LRYKSKLRERQHVEFDNVLSISWSHCSIQWWADIC
jgi:hypothetical protein